MELAAETIGSRTGPAADQSVVRMVAAQAVLPAIGGESPALTNEACQDLSIEVHGRRWRGDVCGTRFHPEIISVNIKDVNS